MRSKVIKWGDSQGIRLSKDILALSGIQIGETVELLVSDKQISIRKAEPNHFDLAELVARIPPGYQAEEVDWGPPVGKEEW